MSYAALCKAIKQIVDTQMAASNLAQYAVGTVISITPLRVKISDRITLEAKDVILTTNVTSGKIPTESYCTQCGVIPGFVMNALSVGDRLVMIKNQGGQEYIIIGKAV
jgi:hypothetical protein